MDEHRMLYGDFIQGRTKVLVWDPCHFGLPEIWTVARMTHAVETHSTIQGFFWGWGYVGSARCIRGLGYGYSWEGCGIAGTGKDWHRVAVVRSWIHSFRASQVMLTSGSLKAAWQGLFGACGPVGPHLPLGRPSRTWGLQDKDPGPRLRYLGGAIAYCRAIPITANVLGKYSWYGYSIICFEYTSKWYCHLSGPLHYMWHCTRQPIWSLGLLVQLVLGPSCNPSHSYPRPLQSEARISWARKGLELSVGTNPGGCWGICFVVAILVLVESLCCNCNHCYHHYINYLARIMKWLLLTMNGDNMDKNTIVNK